MRDGVRVVARKLVEVRDALKAEVVIVRFDIAATAVMLDRTDAGPA